MKTTILKNKRTILFFTVQFMVILALGFSAACAREAATGTTSPEGSSFATDASSATTSSSSSDVNPTGPSLVSTLPGSSTQFPANVYGQISGAYFTQTGMYVNEYNGTPVNGNDLVLTGLISSPTGSTWLISGPADPNQTGPDLAMAFFATSSGQPLNSFNILLSADAVVPLTEGAKAGVMGHHHNPDGVEHCNVAAYLAIQNGMPQVVVTSQYGAVRPTILATYAPSSAFSSTTDSVTGATWVTTHIDVAMLYDPANPSTANYLFVAVGGITYQITGGDPNASEVNGVQQAGNPIVFGVLANLGGDATFSAANLDSPQYYGQGSTIVADLIAASQASGGSSGGSGGW